MNEPNVDITKVLGYRINPLHADAGSKTEVIERKTEGFGVEQATTEGIEASSKERRESQGETKTPTYDDETEKEYGYSIFWVILNTLFPERFRNGKDVSINPNSENFTRCFEDGGFVFNDVNHGLFNILLGANYNSEIVENGNPSCRVNETTKKDWKHKTGTFDKLESKSHFLLDQMIRERSERTAQEYDVFQLIRAQKEYKYGKKQGAKRKAVGITEIRIKFKRTILHPVSKRWHRPVASALGIYERYIGLKDEIGMKAICNPNDVDMPNTSYSIKGSGKSVLKFYCLKFIEKKENGKIFYLTYVKAETLPHGAKASKENKKKSSTRVISRMWTKPQKYEITPRVDKLQILKINFKSINSTEKEVYPYRNEDRGRHFNFRNWKNVTMTENWNTYFNGSNACGEEDCLKEIFQYSNIGTVGESLVPQMRTGYEFFVPSVVTLKIINILEPLKQHFCKAKYDSIMLNENTADFDTFKSEILSSQSGGKSFKKEAFRKSFTKKRDFRKEAFRKSFTKKRDFRKKRAFRKKKAFTKKAAFTKKGAFRKRFTQKRAFKKRLPKKKLQKKRFTIKRAFGKALKKDLSKKLQETNFKKNLASKPDKV